VVYCCLAMSTACHPWAEGNFCSFVVFWQNWRWVILLCIYIIFIMDVFMFMVCASSVDNLCTPVFFVFWLIGKSYYGSIFVYSDK
jgi:hypothetical protein